MKYRVCRTRRLLISTLVSLLLAGLAHAQRTIHVPSDASTIQSAIDVAADGDVVLVAPGTYNENIDFKGRNITVTSGAKSYDDAASVIISGAANGPVVRFQTNEKRTATLNGFTIRDGHNRQAGIPGGGIYISGAAPTISNNLITDNRGCGILAAYGASPEIDNNHITRQVRLPVNDYDPNCVTPEGYGSGPGGLSLFIVGDVVATGNIIEDNVAGISILRGHSLTLINNIVRNNTGKDNNVNLETALSEALFTPVQQLVMIQNLFYGNSNKNGSPNGNNNNSFPQTYLSGTDHPPYPSVVEINNTIADGQKFVQTFGTSIVENNAFLNVSKAPPGASPSAAGLWCAGPASATAALNLQHNLVFNNGTLVDGGCPLSTGGNLITEPLLRDPANGDFREQKSSPMAAAGDISAPQIPAADLDAKARTVCGTIGIGAYQLRPNPLITLSSSLTTVPGGNLISFTAVVQGNCNQPTGSVTFLDGSSTLGTGTLDKAASATLTTSFLTVGIHHIQATYPSDFNFEDGTSNTIDIVVTGPPTTTSITVQPNPAKAFDNITLSAAVTSAYRQPQGTITFTAGTIVIATVPLAGGIATAATSALSAGSYQVTATFNATTEFAGSAATATLEVQGGPTKTLLRASLNPAAYGQAVTFTATVSGAVSASSGPQGSVLFRDGGTILGSAPLDASGNANFTTDRLSVGVHPVTAEYNGTGNYAGSNSSPFVETITNATVQITLQASPNPGRLGQAVSAVATVSAPGFTLPTGLLNLLDGSNVVATAPIGNGSISFTLSNLPVGNHSLLVTFAGSSGFAPTQSNAVTLTVQPFDFSIAGSAKHLSIPMSGYAEMTVTIMPIGGYDLPVQLSCSSLPEYAQCIFDRSTTAALSSGPQQVMLILNASTVQQYGPRGTATASTPVWRGMEYAFMFGITFVGPFRRYRKLRGTVLCVCLFICMGMVQGCGGKLPSSTATGDYIVYITAAGTGTGASVQHVVSVVMHITSQN